MPGPPTIPGNSRFIRTVIRRRRWIITLWLTGLAASALAFLSAFRIDNSVAIWFLEGDPELEDYQRYHAEFGQQEWTYLWLHARDSIYSQVFLRELGRLCDRIGRLDNVQQVVALTEAGGIRLETGGDMAFETPPGDGAGRLPGTDQDEALRDMIRGNPRLTGRLVPRDNDHVTIVAIQNVNHVDSTGPYRIRLIDEMREAAAESPGILDFGIVGTAVINSELNRAARRDMVTFTILIAAFVMLGGGLALRHPGDLAVLGAVVAGTVLPVMGGIAAIGLPFNLITVMLPTLLATVSVSYLVHFLSEFRASRSERHCNGHPGCSEALSATFRRLLRPGLWTAVTTTIGFASLTLSPVAPIRQVGFFAAAGIVLAWLNTLTIAPALLSLMEDKEAGRARPQDNRNRRNSRLLRWLGLPHPVLAVLLGTAMLAGTAGMLRLEADTDYVRFFRPGSKVRDDYGHLNRLGMPVSYLTVTVAVAENVRIADPARHRVMQRFEDALRSLPGVRDIHSLDDTVERIAAEEGTGGGSVDPARLVASLLESSAAGQLSATGEFIARNGRLLQLRVMTSQMSTRAINAFREQLASLARELPDGWHASLTGTNVLWANMDAHVVRTQLLAMGVTAVLLLVLLPLIFRSVVMGLLGFVVSFVPVLSTLGLMAWLGLPVNIATCILGGVVTGIAVDDTIYFLSRVRENMRQGMPVDAALPLATRTTGRAMIKTSLILTGGFLTMTASDFMPSVYFGLLFAFSILVALLADLIVLPALLRCTRTARLGDS